MEQGPDPLSQIGIGATGAIQERLAFLGLALARQPMEGFDLLPTLGIHTWRSAWIIAGKTASLLEGCVDMEWFVGYPQVGSVTRKLADDSC
jgi:hypothetical protein